LAAGDYDVFVLFGSQATDGATAYQLQAGLTSGSLVQYSAASSGAVKVVDDGTAFDGYRIKIGTTTVTGGSLDVFVDNRANTAAADERSYYDGIGYELVPEPSSVALLLGAIPFALTRRRSAARG
jgi:hypothetical protein